MPHTMIEVECCNCKKKFERTLSNYNSKRKRGCKVYCGKSCSAASTNNLPMDWNYLVKNQKDEYSPFRYHLSILKTRSKQKKSGPVTIVEVTLQDLKEQWDKQNGICPYTGWKLVCRNSLSPKCPSLKNRSPRQVSLDRIDSAKGYIKGNIQFVSFMANLAKNNFKEEELIEFCQAVSKYRSHQV